MFRGRSRCWRLTFLDHSQIFSHDIFFRVMLEAPINMVPQIWSFSGYLIIPSYQKATWVLSIGQSILDPSLKKTANILTVLLGENLG